MSPIMILIVALALREDMIAIKNKFSAIRHPITHQLIWQENL